jgi:hypothetical protein
MSQRFVVQLRRAIPWCGDNDTRQSLGHTKREFEDACERLMKSGALENWGGKKHVDLD